MLVGIFAREVLMSTYADKRKESFNTKLNIFLFRKSINEGLDGIEVNEFVRYEINDEDIKEYAGVYYQYQFDEEYPLANPNKPPVKVEEIAQNIESWKMKNSVLIESMEKEYDRLFSNVLLPNKFEEVSKGNKCYYCGITLEDINVLIEKKKLFKKHETRGYVMEIDRKSPNKEYSTSNVETCCYWCNNAKTDEFTEDEFKPIGEMIRNVWVNRGIERLRK